MEEAANALAKSFSRDLPQPGRNMQRYRLGSQIGVGGMGVVFEATDERLQRKAAVKILTISSVLAKNDAD